MSYIESYFLSPAFSAAKDAAGNVDLQKLQQLQQLGEDLTGEGSKKEN